MDKPSQPTPPDYALDPHTIAVIWTVIELLRDNTAILPNAIPDKYADHRKRLSRSRSN
jgi:hypothetical protein